MVDPLEGGVQRHGKAMTGKIEGRGEIGHATELEKNNRIEMNHHQITMKFRSCRMNSGKFGPTMNLELQCWKRS
jgi:hypothetical protein